MLYFCWKITNVRNYDASARALFKIARVKFRFLEDNTCTIWENVPKTSWRRKNKRKNVKNGEKKDKFVGEFVSSKLDDRFVFGENI